MEVKGWFRGMFLMGLILGAISLFLDYYLFEGFDQDGELVVFWSYSPFFDWHTIFSIDSVFNEQYHPYSSSVPLMIHLVFLIAVSISLYGVLFKDMEHQKKTKSNLHFIAYTNLFEVLVSGFYIFIFPIMYLLPNGLYFPSVQYLDPILEVRFYYSVHIGYVIQLISFTLVFSYALFYYHMVFSFKKAAHHPDTVVNHYVKCIQEPLDIDKYIREEQLALANQKQRGKI